MSEEALNKLIDSMKPDASYMIGAAGLKDDEKTLDDHLKELSKVIVDDYMSRVREH